MVLLVIQFGFLLLLNFADLTIGMLLFHLLTFDPGWLRAKQSPSIETLYYDSNCGLCHRTIRLLLAEDRLVNFNFSPLQGPKFLSMKDNLQLQIIPNSILLIEKPGSVLTQSSAIIYLLKKLGGLWVLLGWLLWLIPRPLRDFGYQFMGKIIHKLFKAPEQVCPIIGEDLRNRFV
jgi:predicted DCC family thiol-disulfide oxidoreductase YuxK